jgi:hypothetical protein
MIMQRGRKLNRLQHLLPEGLLADARWLEARSYSSALRSKYVSHGWLEQPARSVYTRPGGLQRWEQVVISLQSVLRLPVAVGGRTALNIQGYAHYLPLGGEDRIQLYAETSLPGWLKKLKLSILFETHNAGRLFSDGGIAEDVPLLPDPAVNDVVESGKPLPHGLRAVSWGQHSWPLLVSAPERAILELLDELPDRETFENVDVLMEGLRTLSPHRLQELLEACASIKVKRLFFWFADRHNLPWLKRLDPSRVQTGTGKRVIAKGGRLDPKYQITVPEALHGGE